MNHKSWSILIADNIQANRDNLRRLLLAGSHEQVFALTECSSGSTLIAALRTPLAPHVDCLLLDDQLPDMDALAVLAALRDADGRMLCPIVVLTSLDTPDMGPVVLRAGAQDFIGKDWLSAPGLVRTVENAVERWLMARELHDRERLLAMRERELRTVTDNSPILLIRFDRSGRHLYINGAVERVSGNPPSYYIGRTQRDAGLPESLCVLWDNALAQVFASSLPLTIEFAFEGALGTLDLTARLVPEFDDAGVIAFVLAVTHDITDRKKMEQALHDNDRRKDLFLATLGHELRNPMAVLSSGLEVLRLAPAGNQVAIDTRDIMARQFRHMVRFVDELLDISRITSGKMTLVVQPVTMQAVIAHAVEATAGYLAAARHVLTLEVPATPALVSGDLTRLAQVLGNLLNNAAKYTPAGGHIRLSLTVDQGAVVLRVHDNGMGIAAAMQSAIFELYTQVNDTPDHARGGLGIGLALARTLLEMHGGSITCDSPGLGQGSTFTVTLPLLAHTDVAVLPVRASSDPAALPAPLRQRVLVIDDNQEVAHALALMLRFDGYQTHIAHDGATGLAALQTFCPHVVLLDLSMPDMSGFDVARQIRAASPAPATPLLLIALTGWDNADDRHAALAAGFDCYLTKPVDPDRLSALLSPACQDAGAR